MKLSADAREPIASRIKKPIQGFIDSEVVGGVALFICVIFVLLWANSPFAESYHALWETHLAVRLGNFSMDYSLHYWINDGLMAIFFFYIGLEVKREILVGELSSPKQVILPLAAALGGMIMPASIYAALNFGRESIVGWGIPMATDIAFSLGVLALLSRYASLSVKVFLISLAIVDDIGAVLVIALFYNQQIHIIPLIIAAFIVLTLLVINWAGVRNPLFYIIPGIGLWYTILQSGVHATIAGVLLAATIPARSNLRIDDFISHSKKVLNDLARLDKEVEGRAMISQQHQEAIKTLEAEKKQVEPPLSHMEHALHPWVTYLIMPIFALSNAGITLDLQLLAALFEPLALGIIFGLVIGKQVGILCFTWLAVKLKIASLTPGLTWRQIYGVGWLAAIGFTMSLFIANLAFVDERLLSAAKESILVASLIAGIGSWLVFKFFVSRERSVAEDQEIEENLAIAHEPARAQNRL